MNPTAEQIGIFILIVVMLMPAIDTVKRWFSGPEKTELSPQPLRIELEREFATKAELGRLELKFEGNIEAMRSTLDEHNRIAEERARKIHGRIDEILRGVARMEGSFEEHVRRETKKS